MNLAVTPFEAYRTFIALKAHFESGYDYIKNSGKTQHITPETFKQRTDAAYFNKIARHKDASNFMLANFVGNAISYAGDLATEKADSVYINWLKRQQAITHIFTEDCNKLLTNFDENFIVKNGQRPYALKLYSQNQISIETLIILNDICKFFPHWNKAITETIIWPSIYKKCIKYKPFFRYDITKCKKILRDKFTGDE
jgi:hypothetical protein